MLALAIVLLAALLAGCAPAAPPSPADTVLLTPHPTPTASPAAPPSPADTALLTPHPTPPPSPTAPAPSGSLHSDKTRIATPDATAAERAVLVAGNNNFAFDLYHRLNAGNADGNLFYSPYSISLAMAMAYAGAAGDTARQMADTLRFGLPPERLHPAFNALDLELAAAAAGMLPDAGETADAPALNISNAVWGQQGYRFRPEYLDILAAHYGAGLHPLDFTQPDSRQDAASQINGWASDRTKGRIPALITPESFAPCVAPKWRCTRLLLTNAVYFKGLWAEGYDFDRSATSDDYFHRKDGSRVKVPMMRQTREFNYAEGDDFQSVALPYRGHRLAMTVLLPAPERWDGFTTGLDGDRAAGIIDSMRPRSVILTMPRLDLEQSISVKDLLLRLGMTDAFSDTAADFSGMADFSAPASVDRGIYIGDVLQKAFVAVNEKGTEAAAVTAVSGVSFPASIPPTPLPPVIMEVDRPYIFLIRDRNTGIVLFVGRVADLSPAR